MTAGSITVPTIVPLRAPVNGKLKNVIDTCTPIELKTETPNAEIFFTVDGSKPDPFAALGADRNTIKYTRPFRLREGKKTVKAVALSRDGARESHVVTKSFEVERCKGLDHAAAAGNHESTAKKSSNHGDGYEFIDELERERKKEIVKKRGILKKIVDTSNLSYRSGGSLSDNESSRYHHRAESPYLGKRFGAKELSFTLDTGAGVHPSAAAAASFLKTVATGDAGLNRRYLMPDQSTQTLRLQRETDFLKCASCFATRPHDPHARFCTECGKSLPQLPQNRLAQPSSGKLGTCFYCKSIVPFNTSICIICENPINPQLQADAAGASGAVKLQGKVICIHCKTPNPNSYASCVACDAKLVPGAVVHADDLALSVPQHPTAATNANKSATCSQCFRINRGDARFCDWCGAKPQKQLGPLPCGRCGASNHPITKFCIACGTIIQPPNYQNANAIAMGSGTATWLANIDSKAAQILNKQYSTCGTQTYGLFYTSAKALESKTEKELRQIEKDTYEKRPTLTAVSAGKGYWRQQMDHICTHLKVYAQNNSEFRAVVGEPRLGKLNSAKVDIDSNWCTVTATFPIRDHLTRDAFNASSLIDRTLSNVNSKLSNADYEMMAAVTAARDSSAERSTIEESNDSDDNSHRDHHSGAGKRRPRKTRDDEKLSGEDRQLAKELGKSGRGRPGEVEELLNEGANPNAVTKDGLSMLHQAIRNRHLECIPVLLRAKAEIKATVPPKKNTVLHEAVLLGSEAGKVIKLLLDFGANPEWKNARNETAFDLAIKENNTAAINALGAHVGEDMVKTYLKAKPGDIRP